MKRKRDDFLYPDVITASDDYQRRFQSAAGQYLLEVQTSTILAMTSSLGKAPLQILELGGAHGQMTFPLLHAGHTVVVQCSKAEGFERLNKVKEQYKDRLRLMVSSPQDLPFENNQFDVVIMVRLLSHLEHWDAVIAEAARVAKRALIFDYPPVVSFNILSPVLFNLKKRIEGNTRRYTCFRDRTMTKHLKQAGFDVRRTARQFLLPMAIHRLWNNPKRAAPIENFSRSVGLTNKFGSPAVV